MLGFNGGLIGTRRVPTLQSASGLWLPNEQSVAKRTGIWPLVGQAYRYYKLSNFAATPLDANAADLTEIELFATESVQTISSASSNVSWTEGGPAGISAIIDGVKSSGSRALKQGWNSVQPTAIITLDMGSTQVITHIKIYSLYPQPRFPESFTLSGSNNNLDYTVIAIINCGTNFASLGGDVFASEKLALP